MRSSSITERGLNGFTTVVFCAFLINGCGNGSSIPKPTTYQQDVPSQLPAANLTDAQTAAQSTQATCAGSECNPSVALLIGVETNRLFSCTASLIAPDIAMTNSHCIPDDLLGKDGADCSNRITLFFPDSSAFPAEKNECATVIHTSTVVNKSDPDYAFISLKTRSKRPALKFAAGGLSDRKAYTITKMDPTIADGHYLGVLRTTTCTPIYETIVVPSSRNANAPVAALKDCSVEHGNSGSPLVDENGEVHGLLQGMVEDTFLNQLIISQQGKLLESDIAPMGIATNLGCVILPDAIAPHALSPACTPEDAATTTANNARSVEAVLKKVTKEAVAQITGTLPGSLEDVFEWTLAERKSGALFGGTDYFLAPKCFKPGAHWLPQFKNFIGMTKSSTTTEIDIPYWKMKLGFNRYLQLDAVITPFAQSSYPSKLRFSPAEVKDRGISWVNLVDENSGLFENSTYLNQPIGLCSAMPARR